MIDKQINQLENDYRKNSNLPSVTFETSTQYSKIKTKHNKTNSFLDPNFEFNLTAIIPIGSREINASNKQLDLKTESTLLSLEKLDVEYKNNQIKINEEIALLKKQLKKQNDIINLQENKINLEKDQFIEKTKLTDNFGFYYSISGRLKNGFTELQLAINKKTTIQDLIILQQIKKELKIFNYEIYI